MGRTVAVKKHFPKGGIKLQQKTEKRKGATQ